MEIVERRKINDGKHERIIVEHRGRVYELTSAEPFPNDDEVKEIWKDERKVFEPHYYMR